MTSKEMTGVPFQSRDRLCRQYRAQPLRTWWNAWGETVSDDPARWLLALLDRFEARPAVIAAAPSSAMVAAPAAQPSMNPGDAARQEARRLAGRQSSDDYGAAVAARTTAALTTDAPFVERLVYFLANYFAVSSESSKSPG